MVYSKKCNKCDCEYMAKRCDSNFCSRDCYIRDRQEKLKNTLKTYKASYYKANRDIILTRSQLRFEKKVKVHHIAISCVHCDILFVPKKSDAKCCSGKCSAALWRTKNVDRQREYAKNKYHTDIQHRLKACLRSRVNKALKGAYKKYSVTKNLGCSPDELVKHLESQFTPGMSWDTYGKGSDKWNVDHIKPLASFDLSDQQQFAEACSWINLQPLWEPANIAKGASL